MALIKLISRKSTLALLQTREVEEALKQLDPALEVEIHTVTTDAERAPTKRIEDFDTTGVFTKALEDALLDGLGDCAVHSAKDLPTSLDERFGIAAYLPRADRRDALVVKRGSRGSEAATYDSATAVSTSVLEDILGPGSTVATGSVRRRAQLSQIRPDLLFCDLRGNMERRLGALVAVDAVIAGACALDRMGISGEERSDLEIFRLDESIVTPAAGQGAIAVEVLREGPWGELWEAINDSRTALEVGAERAFLSGLRAGCSLPVGVTATLDYDGSTTITSVACSSDGHRRLGYSTRVETLEAAAEAGKEFACDAVRLWDLELGEGL